jgi:FkbM family methyltransferase
MSKGDFKNRLKSFIVNRLNSAPPGSRTSYSQCGEDILMDFILAQLGVTEPTYLDIGAHHPTYLNNTFLFYKRGCRGVNIEPDPSLFEAFVNERDSDINLNVGIGIGKEVSRTDFYVMTSRVLNTFSKEEAERIHASTQYKIEKVLPIDLLNVDMIIEKHFKERKPDIISIDVEGWDFDIVKSLDLSALSRTVFCVETLNYSENNTEEKRKDIIDHFIANGFFAYADTYINSLFVNRDVYSKR